MSQLVGAARAPCGGLVRGGGERGAGDVGGDPGTADATAADGTEGNGGSDAISQLRIAQGVRPDPQRLVNYRVAGFATLSGFAHVA